MSRTKLILGIVQDLRNLADGLQDLCNALATSEPANTQPSTTAPATTQPGLADHAVSTKASPDPAVPTVAASSPTSTSDQPPALAPNERIDPETGEIIRLEMTELRALATSKAKTKEQKAAIKALLQKHGVEKLTDLPLADYFVFREEVTAIA